MQFLFHKLALCWDSYHKIQDSFQLLFVFNLGLSSQKTGYYKLPIVIDWNHRRADCSWPPKGEGELFFLPLSRSHTAWVVLAP